MSDSVKSTKDNWCVLAASLAAGWVGIYVFLWITSQGFYALILPGGLAAIGAGVRPCSSKPVAAVCGLWAVFVGLVAEWKFAPFKADDSFGYFLTHVHQLMPIALILIGIGGAIGFYIPFRSVFRDANKPRTL
mgnify:CR=1 FL=1